MHLVPGGRGGGSLLLLLHPGEHLLVPAVPVHGVRHLVAAGEDCPAPDALLAAQTQGAQHI